MFKEIESLIRPPDYEIRCDKFVLEVQNELPDEYPELAINAQNQTKEDIYTADKAKDVFSYVQKEEAKEKLIRQAQYTGFKKDRQSALYNEAIIDITSFEEELINQIIEAEGKIMELSEKYSPSERYSLNKALGSYPFSLRLRFVFA